MGYTAVEKILMKHSVDRLKKVSPGDIVTATVDYVGITKAMTGWSSGCSKRRRAGGGMGSQKGGIFLSHHFCTGHSDDLAENQKETREWAEKLGIRVFDFGSGISHIIIMEEGLAYPGALCVFADSHTTAYGAVGAISTQAGSR